MGRLTWIALMVAGCAQSSELPPHDDAAMSDGAMDASTSGDAARPDGSMDTGPAPTDASAALPILVGTMTDGRLTPYEDGQDVPAVWGPQGGVMILPTIRLATADGWDVATYDLKLSHTAVDGRTFAVNDMLLTQDFQLTPSEVDGYLEFSSLFNPLSEMPVHDTWTRFEVTVSHGTKRGTASAELHLVDATETPACSTFPVRDDMSGCHARELPARMRVTRIEPIGDDQSIVHYMVSASDEVEACEAALGDGAERTTYTPDNCIEGWRVGDDKDIVVLRSGRCGVTYDLPFMCP